MNSVRIMPAPMLAKGACIALAVAGAMVATAKPPASDTIDYPVISPPTRGPATPVRSSGDEGSVAGTDPVIWDNGPISTGEAHACATPGTRSTLQAGLGTFGFGLWAGNNPTPATVVCDDFELNDCAQITEVELYGYQTGATTTTVTGAFVTLHAGRPSCPSSSVIATLNATVAGGGAVVDFTTIYRALPTDVPPGAGCTRRLNRVRVDTSSWPLLPPGEYWLSWSLQGGTSKFCPPVTILGQQGKPGANSVQSLGSGGQFAALIDVVPQDMPFLLRGITEPCGDCPEDINGDNNVGVADLLSVIGAWGPCAGCPQDINGDNVVGVADLLAVIAAWGPCSGGGGPPPFPQDTGACCTGGSCAVMTFGDCLAGGGTYYGDDSTCAAIGSCTITNDECTGAIPLNPGVTTIYTNAATASPETATCSAEGIGSDRWYSINVVPGPLYTIDTLQTAGCDAWIDTVIQVFEACGGAEYACNDDTGGVGVPSSVTFGVVSPTTLFVRIGSWNSVNPGGRIVVNFTQQ